MMANGISASQTAATPSAYANPTSPVQGNWGYGQPFGLAQGYPVNPVGQVSPFGYGAQGYDPRFAMFDARFGQPYVNYDPRFGISPFAEPVGISPLDPRFGAGMPGYDPRFGTALPGYDPRFELARLAMTLTQPGLPYDLRLANWGAGQIQGLGGFGFQNQPFGTWGGYSGVPVHGQEALLGATQNISGLGIEELARGPVGLMPRLGLVGLPRDEEIEEMIHETLDHHPLIPLDAEIDARSENGQVTLTGKVPDKRIKRAAGEAAWWIPGVTDVNNTIVVSGRHQAQANRRRGRQQPAQAGR